MFEEEKMLFQIDVHYLQQQLVMHLKDQVNILHLSMQCGQYEKLVNDSTLLQPDLTYQYKNSDEMKGCYKDYIENNGVYPINEKRKWETKEQLNNRVMSVINNIKKI